MEGHKHSSIVSCKDFMKLFVVLNLSIRGTSLDTVSTVRVVESRLIQECDEVC
jgi:hypothetical protein